MVLRKAFKGVYITHAKKGKLSLYRIFAGDMQDPSLEMQAHDHIRTLFLMDKVNSDMLFLEGDMLQGATPQDMSDLLSRHQGGTIIIKDIARAGENLEVVMKTLLIAAKSGASPSIMLVGNKKDMADLIGVYCQGEYAGIFTHDLECDTSTNADAAAVMKVLKNATHATIGIQEKARNGLWI